MKIAILGATGQVGRIAAKRLATEGLGSPLLIARNADKLRILADEIEGMGHSRPETAVVDLQKPHDLEAILGKASLVLIAVSSAALLPAIVDAAEQAKVDCYDVLLCSEEKRKFLESRRQRFEKRGLCYITDGGYHPGLPAALTRWAETLCPGLVSAEVLGCFRLDWRQTPVANETIVDFVREIKHMDVSVLQNGVWNFSWKHTRRFDFGDGRGPQNCIAMGMDEMRLLPETLPALRNAGFYIAGFGPVIDWVLMPFVFFALSLVPKALDPVARFFAWGLRTFGGHTNEAKLVLKGAGPAEKIQITLSYSDPYELTVLPVVACLKQIIATGTKPGLCRQALFVEPASFWQEMQRLGVKIRIFSGQDA